MSITEYDQRQTLGEGYSLSGVICDKKVSVKLKDKLYKTVIRPTLIYGSDCWALHRAEKDAHNQDANVSRRKEMSRTSEYQQRQKMA